MNYYNEIDPSCVAWLKQLIAEKLIPPGDVDHRDIRDVRPVELQGYAQCHFFAGIGGWPLALAYAGVGPDEPLWTGSCPCQPFSAAGKRGGFSDERHLWPYFHYLIAQRRPPKVYGEQVASASDWLRLVRGDLEALDYAVGAMPIEAASAGAGHLRDRFWFVADHEHAREGRRGIQRPSEGSEAAGERPPDQLAGSGFDDVADRYVARPQGRIAVFECAGERSPGPHGVDLAEPCRDGARCGSGGSARTQAPTERKHWRSSGASFAPGLDGEVYEWAVGADGKARRVKPGVRLLVDGFPSRVGLLRGFGNAIDPRPAAAFIRATR